MSLAHFDSTEFGNAPPHWGPFIQRMIAGIAAVLSPDEMAAFYFSDVKEKYGRLSVSWRLAADLDATTEAQIELHIRQAEESIARLDAQLATRRPRA